MSNEVWVFAEHADGAVVRSSLEVLGEARRLADALRGSVTALLFGHAADLASTLGQHGADRVFSIVGPDLGSYDPEAYVLTITRLLATEPVRLFLSAASTTGSDLCARLAIYTGAPAITQCVNFNVRGERLELIRALYGGKVHAAFTVPENRLVFATITPDVIGVGAPDSKRETVARALFASVPEVHTITVLEIVAGDPRTLDLTEAEVIISAGRGLGRKENLALLEELASLLGGTLAGTRVAVDLGWLPRERQVGQTGKTVAPKLYIACGISGATQHTVGIKQSEHIVAINIDEGCGLFKVADLALQGDVTAVLPALLRRLQDAEVAAG